MRGSSHENGRRRTRAADDGISSGRLGILTGTDGRRDVRERAPSRFRNLFEPESEKAGQIRLTLEQKTPHSHALRRSKREFPNRWRTRGTFRPRQTKFRILKPPGGDTDFGVRLPVLRTPVRVGRIFERNSSFLERGFAKPSPLRITWRVGEFRERFPETEKRR